jgi:Snare region anchored in the vesicle membrane C-terminus/Vesicle transport v-SNARE protein N-terminus
MEIEIQAIPQSVRAQYHTRLRTAKSALSRYKKLLKDQKGQIARTDLLSTSRPISAPSDDPYAPSSDRTRLLAGTSMLEDGSRRLQESQRIALETESQGNDILLNLRTQREQIENTRSTVCLEYEIWNSENSCPLSVTHRRLQHRPCVRNAEEDDKTVRTAMFLASAPHSDRFY